MKITPRTKIIGEINIPNGASFGLSTGRDISFVFFPPKYSKKQVH